MKSFEGLNLSAPILQAVKSKGYHQPTPVQILAIPAILNGQDVLGSAQTGTGKTAAFALPLLQRMSSAPKGNHPVRTLVLAPTRELAIQIGDSFRDYGKNSGFRLAVIYGGVSQHSQTMSLRKGVDIIVATPGRLLDLMNQGFVKLNEVEFLVLDEADRMLDMGFIHDIKRIVSKVPAKRQTLLFSATLPAEVQKLTHDLLHHPVRVDIEPIASEAVLVSQQIHLIEKNEKTDLLCRLAKEGPIDHALVFTRTRRGADKLVKALNLKGIRSQAIHGDKSQNQRQRVLEDFKRRKIHMLVATDVASRGIDVKDLSHVINYELPDQADSYTHRIGRTGRAGKEGIAISFCSREEKNLLRGILKLQKKDASIEIIKSSKQESGPEPEVAVLPERSGSGHRPAGSSNRSRSRNGKRPFRSSGKSRSSFSRGRFTA